MSQKNDTLKIFLALIVTLGVLVLAIFWFGRLFFPTNNQDNISNSPQTENNSAKNIPLNKRISNGDSLLIPSNSTPQKQTAIQELGNQNYNEAIKQLENSLKINSNDPESLIYLNNARIGTNESYQIAVSVPIGSDIDGSQEILRGVAQAQNDINSQGGINGIPLQVIIANDNNNPEIAQKLVPELAKNSRILGVVGHWASDVTLATAPIYEAKKLVAISPISTSVKLSGFGDYIYRTVPSDRFAGNALSRYQINNLKKKKTAIFYNSQSGYSQSLKDEFTTALYADGGEVVAEFDFAKSNFNAGRSYPEALNKGAEVLMLATSTSTLDQALQVIQVNEGKLPVLAGDDAYSPKILEIGRKDAVDMVVAIPWHILAYPNSPFVQESRRLWGGDVNWRTATAYDATMALAEAMKVNPTREGIEKALSASNFVANGATSPVRFLPSGDRNQAVQLVTVAPGNNPNLPYQFVPINP